MFSHIRPKINGHFRPDKVLLFLVVLNLALSLILAWQLVEHSNALADAVRSDATIARALEQEVQRNRARGEVNTEALCAFRDSLAEDIKGTERILKQDNADDLLAQFHVTRAEINRTLEQQRNRLKALRVLDCD